MTNPSDLALPFRRFARLRLRRDSSVSYRLLWPGRTCSLLVYPHVTLINFLARARSNLGEQS